MTRQISTVDTGWRHRFAFFAECVIVGLAILVAGILLLTLPAAIAAGATYLRAWGAGEAVSLAFFGRTLRTEFHRLWTASTLWLLATLTLLGEIALVTTLNIPLAALVSGMLLLLATAIQLIMLRLIALGDLTGALPHRIRTAATAVVEHPRGTLMLLTALLLTAVVTWQLPPLLVPALGLLALATASVGALEEHTTT